MRETCPSVSERPLACHSAKVSFLLEWITSPSALTTLLQSGTKNSKQISADLGMGVGGKKKKYSSVLPGVAMQLEGSESSLEVCCEK